MWHYTSEPYLYLFYMFVGSLSGTELSSMAQDIRQRWAHMLFCLVIFLVIFVAVQFDLFSWILYGRFKDVDFSVSHLL